MLLGVACFLAFVAVSFNRAVAAERNESFRKIAQRYKGTFRAADTWGSLLAESNAPRIRQDRTVGPRINFSALFERWRGPRTSFHYAGTSVVLDTASTGGKHPTYYTQIHFAWADHSFRMEIYPESFFQFGKFLGMQDIEIGSPNFDRDYIITSNNVLAVRGLLSREVQSHVNTLRALTGNNDIYVLLQGGRLTIKKRGSIRKQALLDRFVELGLAMHDAAVASTNEGIEFVDEPRRRSASTDVIPDDVVCQICGDALTSGVVACKACRTPHHEDCWTYYGACSTYGCGQKRFTRKAPSSQS